MSAKYTSLMDNNELLLNTILIHVIDEMAEATKASLYGDLHQRYLERTNLIKTKKDRLNFVNTAYRGIKRFKSKLSFKERVFQRVVDIDIVEEILSDYSYKVGNFEWSIDFNCPDDTTERDLLANCLSDYDVFCKAIDFDVITILNSIYIHDEVALEIPELNEYIMERIKWKKISFYQDNLEVPNYSDEEISHLIEEWRKVTDLEEDELDALADEGEEFLDDTSEDMINIYNYFVLEYLNEVRDIAFKLYCVYEYFVEHGIPLIEITDEGMETFQRLYHYYNLDYSDKGIGLNDTYLRDYDELSQFYRMYIYYLRLALVGALRDLELEDVDLSNPNVEALDINDLTHKLILAIKKRKKDE